MPRASDRVFSWLVVGLMAGFALTMGSLGFVRSTWVAAALMLATGIGNGYIGVVLMASVQRMTDERLLGRVMSLIMLAIFGLIPISEALAGLIMGASSTALFVSAGAGFSALAVFAVAKRSIWTIQGRSATPETEAGPAIGAVARTA